MTQKDWNNADMRVLGVFLNGDELREVTPDGVPVIDDSFLLLFNAGHEDVEFTLPSQRFGRRWTVALTTGDKERRDEECGAARGVLRRGPLAAGAPP